MLTELFDVLYYASLRTEESEAIAFHVVYLDPEDPDPSPPPRIVRDRWRYFPLGKPLAFNVDNAVKIAKATDPRISSLAVYPVEDRLTIHGLVDQGNRYHDFIHYESESGPQRAGAFQASIAGLAHVVAFDQYDIIAELRVDRLVALPVDVLRSGPIRLELSNAIDAYVSAAFDNLEFPDALTSRGEAFWREHLARRWVATLCRILLRIQNFHHGGALLLTDDDAHESLNVKFALRYDRLRTAVQRAATSSIEGSSAGDEISDLLDQNADDMAVMLYLEESVAEIDLDESRSEIDGAVWFAALLSRVDGLVLMTKDIDVLGFGVEITENTPLEHLKSPRARELQRAGCEPVSTRIMERGIAP